VQQFPFALWQKRRWQMDFYFMVMVIKTKKKREKEKN